MHADATEPGTASPTRLAVLYAVLAVLVIGVATVVIS
jgi:hypothetical protein